MRSWWSRRVALLVCAQGLACGGGGSSPTPIIAVAGAYDIRKTFVEDTCPDGLQGQTFTNPGTVSHSPGASRFVLTDHGTRDLPGTVQPDGAFVLEPAHAVVHGTIPALDTWEDGRFTTTGFQVRNVTSLEATATTAACHLVAQWEGTKVGSPNVIP
jgi:hypothetical protein